MLNIVVSISKQTALFLPVQLLVSVIVAVGRCRSKFLHADTLLIHNCFNLNFVFIFVEGSFRARILQSFEAQCESIYSWPVAEFAPQLKHRLPTKVFQFCSRRARCQDYLYFSLFPQQVSLTTVKLPQPTGFFSITDWIDMGKLQNKY